MCLEKNALFRRESHYRFFFSEHPQSKAHLFLHHFLELFLAAALLSLFAFRFLGELLTLVSTSPSTSTRQIHSERTTTRKGRGRCALPVFPSSSPSTPVKSREVQSARTLGRLVSIFLFQMARERHPSHGSSAGCRRLVFGQPTQRGLP